MHKTRNRKKNKFRNISKNRVSVELTQGQRTIVSKKSWDKIKHLKFCASWDKSINNFYVVTFTNGKRKSIHTLIKPSRKGLVTDHINGNTLDNTDENLNPNQTHGQNIFKAKKHKTAYGIPCMSKYKGVSKVKKKGIWNGNWKSYITINKKRYYMGVFKKEKDAADAYKKAHNNWTKHHILPKKHTPWWLC